MGTDVFRCERTGKTCSVRVSISQQTNCGCQCHVVIQSAEKTCQESVVGENWYQAVTLTAQFIRHHLAENYAGYRCEDGEDGGTSSVHNVYPRIVNPSYGTDVYNDICDYMDKKIQGIEDEMTRKFGSSEDGNEQN